MQLIHTDKAPGIIGPYSQAVTFKDLVFVSGQIALSPETGKLVGSNVQEQTKQCLENITFILREAKAEISTILKVVIFLKNMDDFTPVNEIYEIWLKGHRPSRSTIAVSDLPRQALVKIECIASISNNRE